MTRTMHNAYPAAVLKDKHSRSGHKDDLQRKGGAGAHNWGALGERGNQEAAGEQDAHGEATGAGAGDADADRMFDMDEAGAAPAGQAAAHRRDTMDSDGLEAKREDEVAQSPSDSMASFESNGVVERPIEFKGRRMSSMSEEDQAHALAYRQTFGLRPNGANLADIARTSFGAQSPPKGDMLAGSPTKSMRTYAK